jgi:hypothetical protein
MHWHLSGEYGGLGFGIERALGYLVGLSY